MRHTLGLLLAATLAGSARAGLPPAPVSLSYHVFFAGLDVADMHAQFAFTGDSYHAVLGFELTGLAKTMFGGHAESTSDGRFAGDAAHPRQLFSTGLFGGKWRVTEIDYAAGQPKIQRLEPPLEKDRDPVTPAEQAGSVDSVSAMAALLRQVWTAGTCDSRTRIFDGRWLSQIVVHNAGEEVLPPTGRSPFHGTALRCDIVGTQLAGFQRDGDAADARKPHRATVWFAPLSPGGPVVPVRVAVETRGGFGWANIYLTGES